MEEATIKIENHNDSTAYIKKREDGLATEVYINNERRAAFANVEVAAAHCGMLIEELDRAYETIKHLKKMVEQCPIHCIAKEDEFMTDLE
jgi:viroplasmin and RNaseH domain-containing protein